MRLLIDFFEEAATYLREKREKLQKLDSQFRRIYDKDIKHEMAEIRREIAKKSGEVSTEILYNLEEFRALHKYFPELLSVYMDDESIGRIISKKAWLLDYRQTPAQEATAKLEQLKQWRAQLKDAKKFLRRWTGTVDSRSFTSTYPILRGHLSGDMDKQDVLAAIDRADKILLKEGWLLLISDSLIQIPIAKFMTNINNLRYDQIKAQADMNRMRGRGTIAETNALRKLQAVTRKKEHYERALTQLLLSNPNYLKNLKSKKNWLARDKGGNLEKIAHGITPHTIAERLWLNEMKKRIEGEEQTEKKPEAKKKRKK